MIRLDPPRLTAATTALVMTLAVAPGVEASCVHPDGDDGCETTIQAGVNTALAGETVEIAKGVYFENVTVPAGKNGLVLLGKGAKKTILDPDAPNAGIGVFVQSSDVRIEGLMIRNGVDDGIEVAAGTSGFTLVDAIVQGPAGACVDSDGSATTVEGSTLRGCAEGIISDDDDLTVTDSEFVQTSNRGIYQVGNGLRASDNKFLSTRGHAVAVVGDDSRVENCKFERAFSDVFNVQGADAVFVGNKVDFASGGVDVSEGSGFGSDNLVVEGNKFSTLFDEAARWSCSTTCTSGSISGNKIKDVFDRESIDASTNAGTLTIAENKISNAQDTAIVISTTEISATAAIVIDGNKIKRTGHVDTPAILVEGSGVTVTDNSIGRSGGTGIEVDDAGVGAVVSGNKLSGGLASGIDVIGTTAEVDLIDNKISKNRGIGIDISGSAMNTLVSGNKVGGNGIDFCDGGVGTIDDGTNKFDTLGPCS